MDKNGVCWTTWDRLCISKFDGGFRFRDPHCFNLALLAKQCWRLLRYPNSLVAKVLQAKYFDNLNFLTANGGSQIWKSLMIGRELLIKGLVWRIRDGCATNI